MDIHSVAGETLRPLFSALARAQARARTWRLERRPHAEIVREGRAVLARAGLELVLRRRSLERRRVGDTSELVLEQAYALRHESGARIRLRASELLESCEETEIAAASEAITAHLVLDLLLVAPAKHEHTDPSLPSDAVSQTQPHLAMKLRSAEAGERDAALARDVLHAASGFFEDGMEAVLHILTHRCGVEPGTCPTNGQLKQFLELLEPEAKPATSIVAGCRNGRNGTDRGAP